MFKLKLLDRTGVELNQGDIVKVSNRNTISFYAEVKFLEKEKAIAPFHTFSFHSFEKVDTVPENAVKSSETRYNVWYLYNPETDPNADQFENYLKSWRECEFLTANAFSIELI